MVGSTLDGVAEGFHPVLADIGRRFDPLQRQLDFLRPCRLITFVHRPGFLRLLYFSHLYLGLTAVKTVDLLNLLIGDHHEYLLRSCPTLVFGKS